MAKTTHKDDQLFTGPVQFRGPVDFKTPPTGVGGGASFPLTAPDGTASEPSYTFTSAPGPGDGTGLFSPATAVLGLAAEGGEVARCQNPAGDRQFIVSPQGPRNDASTPVLALGDGDTGFYEATDDDLRLAIAGTHTYTFTAAQFLIPDGTNPAPAVAFLNDPDTGLKQATPGTLTVVLSGGAASTEWIFQGTRFSASAVSGWIAQETPSATNPTIGPNITDLDTGIGHAAANQLSVIAGGAESARFTATQLLARNGSEGSPGISLINDSDTGFYRSADGTFGFSSNGGAAWGISGTALFAFNVPTFKGPALLNETASATNPTFAPDRTDPDTGIGWAAADQPSLIGGGAELARGVAPASGGLQANNQATGGGLERVLTTSDGFPQLQFPALQLDNPNNADWAVNSLAPASADSNNNALTVRRFDDTVEEGVGLLVKVPAGATRIDFTFKSRAQTAPAGARTVGLELYTRSLPDDGAITAWSQLAQLSDVDIPANENFQDQTVGTVLANTNLVAGEVGQIEITRINPTGGTELTGDWVMAQVIVSFSAP